MLHIFYALYGSGDYFVQQTLVKFIGIARALPGIFQGRGVFLELGHFDKHSPTTQERKFPRGKNLSKFVF